MTKSFGSPGISVVFAKYGHKRMWGLRFFVQLRKEKNGVSVCLFVFLKKCFKVL